MTSVARLRCLVATAQGFAPNDVTNSRWWRFVPWIFRLKLCTLGRGGHESPVFIYANVVFYKPFYGELAAGLY